MLNSHRQENSAVAAAKSLQSCPTLCNPIDGSPLGSSVPGILEPTKIKKKKKKKKERKEKKKEKQDP